MRAAQIGEGRAGLDEGGALEEGVVTVVEPGAGDAVPESVEGRGLIVVRGEGARGLEPETDDGEGLDERQWEADGGRFVAVDELATRLVRPAKRAALVAA
jgi:hypothetical protein